MFPKVLREHGFDLVVHDDEYPQIGSYDPWLFYECGKRKLIVITSDKRFMKSFPHMAAIALGRTTVLAFTNNSYESRIRSAAFIKSFPEMYEHLKRMRGKPFIGSVGMSGEFRIVQVNPWPNRVQCDQRDWDSFEDVCRQEGVLALAPSH